MKFLKKHKRAFTVLMILGMFMQILAPAGGVFASAEEMDRTELTEEIKDDFDQFVNQNQDIEVKDEDIIEDLSEKEDLQVANDNNVDFDTKLQVDREPEKILENIIDGIKLLYKDKTEFEDGDLIGVNDNLRFELKWSLPNDKNYVAGDYFEFQLPEKLTVYNLLDGSLGDYGTYTVDMKGNVKFIFNKKVEEESKIKGTFWMDTELKESKITSIEETIDLVFNDEIVGRVIVNVKPTAGQAISKEGQPIGGNFETEEITWTVIINTTRESLKNVIINDPILSGQELILNSIQLREVEVDLSGKFVKELDKVTDFPDNSTENNLNIKLGNTNKAYKLTFKTKLLEKDLKEGTTNYENTAYLKSEGIEDAHAGGSVSITRRKFLEKTSSEFNKTDRSIEWTINANFTEQNLKKNDVITDKFTFTVGKDELKDVFEIKEENISIKQVDKFNDEGIPTETSDAKDLFNITIEENKVTYELKEDSNKAFIIKYKTELKEGAYINKDGTIKNRIDFKGKASSSSQGVYQQVGKKSNSGINYKDKTIDWTITVNADKQELKNFVLTDSFAGSGQELVATSIKIDPEINNDKFEVNADNDGFTIDFGDIEKQYKITYKTKFTYDFESGKNEDGTDKAPNFKNGVKVTYDTSADLGYELEFGSTVTPNPTTKNNGAKNGTVNQETKEITWKVDINYNQLELDNARLIDEFTDNQSLFEKSTFPNQPVKIYETTINEAGEIKRGDEVTRKFEISISGNKVEINFGKIDKSYRIEFKTKDEDGIYNSDEKYINTAKFIPRPDVVHNLTANVTLPNQGEFIGKSGTHNKEDWTIDWKIDVNKSLSTTRDFTVTDDLGDPAVQILLEDTIKVTKAGSQDELVEGDGKDYKLTVEGNKFTIYFPGDITEAFEITYSSYIVSEDVVKKDGVDISNKAEIQSNDVIKGTTEKKETVNVKISTGGGTAEGTTGGLIINKTEQLSKQKIKDVKFSLVKKIGNKDIIVREGITDDDGVLEWKGLKHGEYTLKEETPEGYLEVDEISVNISSNDPESIKKLPIINTRIRGKVEFIKKDNEGNLLPGVVFEITKTGENDYFNSSQNTSNENGVVSFENIPYGSYEIKEVSAPKGYIRSTKVTKVEVKEHNSVYELEDYINTRIRANIILLKTDQHNRPLRDAEFALYDITGAVVQESVKSDSNGIVNFKGVAYGDYTIKETKAPANHIKSDLEFKVQVSEHGSLITKDIEDQELTSENTYVSPTTEVKGSKIWVNGPEVKPTIELQLYRNGVAHRDPVTLESGIETHTWKGLDLTDTRGNYYKYTIKEVNVPEYYTESYSEDGLTVTNTYLSPIRDIKVDKVWVNGPDVKPTVQLQLYKGGEKHLDPITLEDGKTSHTWKDLDTTDSNGKLFKYTVKEVDTPDNYNVTYSEDRLTVTNTYVSPKMDVLGSKVWVGGPDIKPTIELQLYRNNKVYGNPVTLVDGQLTHTWNDLDVTDEDGNVYNYSIQEVNLPEDYDAYTSEDGLTITNVHYSEEGSYEPEDPKDPVVPTDPTDPTLPGTEDTPGTGGVNKPDVPTTGIENNQLFYMTTLILGGAGLFVLSRKRKEEEI